MKKKKTIQVASIQLTPLPWLCSIPQIFGRSGDCSHLIAVCIRIGFHKEPEQPFAATTPLEENPRLASVTHNHNHLSFPERFRLTLHNDSVISYIRIGKILTVKDIRGQQGRSGLLKKRNLIWTFRGHV